MSMVPLFCLIGLWGWNQGAGGSHIPVALQPGVRAEDHEFSSSLPGQDICSRWKESERTVSLCSIPERPLHTWSMRCVSWNREGWQDCAKHDWVGPRSNLWGTKQTRPWPSWHQGKGARLFLPCWWDVSARDSDLAFPTPTTTHKQRGLPWLHVPQGRGRVVAPEATMTAEDKGRAAQIPLPGLRADAVSPTNPVNSILSFQRNLLSLGVYQEHGEQVLSQQEW